MAQKDSVCNWDKVKYLDRSHENCAYCFYIGLSSLNVAQLSCRAKCPGFGSMPTSTSIL